MSRPDRLQIRCDDVECEFRGGLPVFVVDRDIYDYTPTLIVSTVDKFARLPWDETVGRLFGTHQNVSPPSLVVQDELHLISGPLGTLTGLYETAIDALCSLRGSAPKVIASTATIRGAPAQLRALFNRDVRQFPPPALDNRDSYYAVEVSPDERGTRRYVGLMTSHHSHSMLLYRTYAVLLQAAHDLDVPDSVKDAYWTLVGYFNSLRVLGGTRMGVQDDVGDWVEFYARSSGTEPRVFDTRIELTSRESSGQIPEHLEHLQVEYGSPEVVDIVLATNMISVGVDIERLGLMVVMGQPQTTSEYIQATSRVGRRIPGLVPIAFNAGRSRDRSHYESFLTYHSALYRGVESTSVTPFAARSRDRGLHAVLIGLVRLLLPAFSGNTGAAAIADHAGELEAIKALILDRVREIDPVDRETVLETEAHLDDLIAAWRQRAQSSPGLRFNDRSRPDRSLLQSADTAVLRASEAFPTLWSLRDVDPGSNLFLIGESDD